MRQTLLALALGSALLAPAAFAADVTRTSVVETYSQLPVPAW